MGRIVGKASLRIALAVATVGAVVASAAPAGSVAGFGDVAHGRFYTAAVQWMVDEAIALADRILVMRDGRIAFEHRTAGRGRASIARTDLLAELGVGAAHPIPA